jgi:glycosyltransferase involved in cell wall biosynthesis
MQKTAIIIPCYNEALRLNTQEFIDSIRSNEYLYYIFVNDGSTDGTQEKLNTLCCSHPTQMNCISLKKNSGKAEAVRKGVLNALESDFANIGYWDADLATPLSIIPRFCELLDNTRITMVIGSRVKLLGRKIERRALRHYLGRFFATFASLVLSLPVYDTQCGAKIFKNSKELKIVFSKPFSVKWTFDVEILARFIMIERFGGINPLIDSAIEYPLEEWTDVSGSKIKITDFLMGTFELFKIFLFLYAPRAEHRFSKFFTD